MRAALAACALCLAVGLGPGATATLAGPGVTLSSSANSETRTISGAQIRAAADTGPTTYTVRSSPNSAGTKRTLRGLSIRGLLTLAGFDPDIAASGIGTSSSTSSRRCAGRCWRSCSCSSTSVRSSSTSATC